MLINLLDFLKFIFAAIISYTILKKYIPLLKKFFPANPNQRSLHKYIKPSSGGISFIVTCYFFAIFQGFLLPILSLPMALVGMIDDRFNLSRIIRYTLQIITVLSFSLFLMQNPNLFISKLIDSNFAYFIILLFIGSVIINSINFMDGIDGLVAGCVIIIFTTLNLNTNYFLTPIIGALFGFIIFNWYPSKVFMGDSGSLFLGSFLTSLIFSSNNLIEIIKILFLISPLLLDSLSCIFKRLLIGQNIFKSHKLHLYQRLVSNGLSHSKVSLLYILSIFFLSIFYLFFDIVSFAIAVSVIISLGVYLDKNYAAKFN